MEFQPLDRPFRYWLGPYSPARGSRAGFRFHDGLLGVWVDHGETREFWHVTSDSDLGELSSLVLDEWGGGRVLFLPTGEVIKPLPGEDEVGRRVLIGYFSGEIGLARPNGPTLYLGERSGLVRGDQWPGPRSIGLECQIDRAGALSCTWYHPAPYGRQEVSEDFAPSDASLAKAFRSVWPMQLSGRVQVIAGGLVITNRQLSFGRWRSSFLGISDISRWRRIPQWIS